MFSCFVVSLMFVDVPNLCLPVETIIFSLHKIISSCLYFCDGNVVTSILICYRGYFIEHRASLRRGRYVKRLMARRDGVLRTSCFHCHPQFRHTPPHPVSR